MTADVFGPEAFARAADVSRETLARLIAYDAALLDWSGRMNLVSRASLTERWRRHFLDSAQLFPLIPERARRLIDIGSGAGFPGLVLAAMGVERGIGVILIESTGKKCAFLNAAAEAMGLPNVEVRNARAESLALSKADVITARALAPLVKLLDYARPYWGDHTIGLFPKGQDVDRELTDAARCWHMDVKRHASHTSADSVILQVSDLQRV